MRKKKWNISIACIHNHARESSSHPAHRPNCSTFQLIHVGQCVIVDFNERFHAAVSARFQVLQVDNLMGMTKWNFIETNSSDRKLKQIQFNCTYIWMIDTSTTDSTEISSFAIGAQQRCHRTFTNAMAVVLIRFGQRLHHSTFHKFRPFFRHLIHHIDILVQFVSTAL